MTASARRLWLLVAAGPPSSTDELAVKLAGQLRLPFDDEFASATRDALTFMDQAGLVRATIP